jgi:hypothetical protein
VRDSLCAPGTGPAQGGAIVSNETGSYDKVLFHLNPELLDGIEDASKTDCFSAATWKTERYPVK